MLVELQQNNSNKKLIQKIETSQLDHNNDEILGRNDG